MQRKPMPEEWISKWHNLSGGALCSRRHPYSLFSLELSILLLTGEALVPREKNSDEKEEVSNIKNVLLQDTKEKHLIFMGEFSKTFHKEIVFQWKSHRQQGLHSPVFLHTPTLSSQPWRACAWPSVHFKPFLTSLSSLVAFLRYCSSDSHKTPLPQPPAPHQQNWSPQ